MLLKPTNTPSGHSSCLTQASYMTTFLIFTSFIGLNKNKSLKHQWKFLWLLPGDENWLLLDIFQMMRKFGIAMLLLLQTVWLYFSIDCCEMLQLYIYHASLYISVLLVASQTLPVMYSACKIMSEPASWKCIASITITINITMVIIFF